MLLSSLLFIHSINPPHKIAAEVKAGEKAKVQDEFPDPEQDEESDLPESTEEIKEEKADYKPGEVAFAKDVIEKTSPAEARLKISGQTLFSAGGVWQKDTDEGKKESHRPYFGIGYTYLKFEASVDDKVGKRAGYTFRIDPQVSGISATRNYGWFEIDRVGYFQFGNAKPVYDSLWKFAQPLVGGFSGWDGSFPSLYKGIDGTFEGTDFIPYSNTATQFTYITPKFFDCVQLGVTYVPQTWHRGNGELLATGNPKDIKGAKTDTGNHDVLGWNNDKARPLAKDHINVVARIHKVVDKFSWGLGLTYLWDHASVDLKDFDLGEATSKPIKVRNGSAFGVSGKIGYGRTELGVEFMHCGRSHLPYDDKVDFYALTDSKEEGKGKQFFDFANGHEGDAGKSITAVLAHKWTDKIVTSLGYQWTGRRLNKENYLVRNSVIATFDYEVMPGLIWVNEADWVMSRNTGKKDQRNNGLVLLTGFKVSL